MKTYNYEFKSKSDFLKNLNNFDKNSKNILIQVFSGVIDFNILSDLQIFLNTTFPNAQILGTTTDGEIIASKVKSGSIVVSISVFDNTEILSNIYECNSGVKSSEVFSSIENDLIKDNTKALIIFSDWTCFIEDILEKLFDKYPHIYVAGGKAGDNYKFKHPYLFTKDKIQDSGIIVGSLNSDILNVFTKYNFSWEKIGKEMIVTKADGKRIYEIDNLPVSKIYEKYLGKIISDQLPFTGVQFPLIINRNGYDVARDVLQKFDDGSLLLAGNINVGDKINFGCGNPDDILSGVYQNLKEANNIPIESMFLYSCTARKTFLGEDILQEILPISSFFTSSGFFTYGEIFHSGEFNEVLNETLTFLCLSESNHVNKLPQEYIENLIKNKKFIPSREKNSYFALSNLVKVTNDELLEANESLIDWNKNLENKIKEATNKIQTQKDIYFEGYKSIIENSNDMICIIDKETNILYSNSSFLNTTGFSLEEILGNKITDYILTNFSGSCLDFDCDKSELKMLCKNKTIINISACRYEFMDEGYTVIIKNLEEIFRLKEGLNKLKELDQKKDEFINIASHELRTPMTTIKGYVSMMINEDLGKIDNGLKSYLNIVYNDTQRLINLINDMLDISKIESGNMSFSYEYIELVKFVKDIIFEMKVMAVDKFINIEFNTDIDKVKFLTDKERLKQVIINILGNAIKFTPENGEIKVNLLLNNNLSIEIIDNGIGIEEKNLNKIFEKFGQVTNSLKKTQAGTGLGLPIAKKIVNILGGDIKLDSKFGKGSKFTIILPFNNK